ncbi:MAG: glycosyl hydrolase [Polyangiaceae bacterium]
MSRSLSALVLVLAVPLWTACGSSGAGKSTGVGATGNPVDGGTGADGSATTEAPDGTTGVSTGGDGGTDAGTGGNDDGGEGGVIGDSTGTVAVRANDFLNSVGVCVHVAQGVDSPSQSATALSYAGIRNIRDDGNPAVVTDWIAMHQSAGVHVDVLSNQNVSSTIGMATQLNDAGALLAVEGPNEPNNFPVTYEGQTSSSTTFVPVADFQRDLYAAVKADTSLTGIPVFHSSEAGGSEPNNVGLQFLTIPDDAGTLMPAGTQYADYGNIHNYVCGHSNDLVDNAAWNASDPTLNGDWDGLYVEYGHTWNGGFTGYSNADLMTLPRVTTETGWLTMGTGAITEEQQARVFLDLYLSAFKRGFSYTFIYMLRDDPVQGYWGLFDTGYNAKTSGTYVHNLTTILADTGARTPGKLNYSIASEPATVHDLLLQKSDGTFDLLVWDERLAGGMDSVTVDLGTSRATVTIYDPTTGTAPTQTMSDVSSVPLMLTDHPVVLTL